LRNLRCKRQSTLVHLPIRSSRRHVLDNGRAHARIDVVCLFEVQ
jgi:hypothetical protein